MKNFRIKAQFSHIVLTVVAGMLCAASAPCQTLPTSGEDYAHAPRMAPGQADVKDELQRSYSQWKSAYLTAAGAGGYLRAQRTDNGNDTVSESIGYAMLITAYFEDRDDFGQLWNYAKSHADDNGLMQWHVSPDGKTLGEGGATDADEDMAFALIVADTRWGSYGADARKLIQAIMKNEVDAGSWMAKPGDKWGDAVAVVNPSYLDPAFYRVFAVYTGDPRWERTAAGAYRFLGLLLSKPGTSTTGLVPDWCTPAGDEAVGRSHAYTYDATRTPWRLARDAAWNGAPVSVALLQKTNAFFQKTGAANIKDGYSLDGSVQGQYHNAAFVGPAAASAIISTDTAYRSSLWSEVSRMPSDNYFNSSLRLLTMLFVSGHMPPPHVTKSDPK